MKLRTRKLLLNLASVGCLAAGVAAIVCAVTLKPERETEPGQGAVQLSLASDDPREAVVVDVSSDCWTKQWRRPLYDPPPVVKEVVVAPPRPVTFKLTGMVLDDDASQAFLKLSNGEIALRQVGDQVTNNPLDGKVAAINANEIVVKRQDDEIRLSIDNQN